MEAFTTEQLKCRGYVLVMHSISKTGVFHKQFFLVSASSDKRTCFHSNQSGVLLAFFYPSSLNLVALLARLHHDSKFMREVF